MHARQSALQRQLRRTEKNLADLKSQSNHLSNIRLSVIIAGIFLTIAAYRESLPFWVIGIISLIVFVGLVIHHRRIQRSIEQHQAWQDIKQSHLARMTLDWQHIPPAIALPNPHPFEIDLDLATLHRLINTTSSNSSAGILRDWLLNLHPDANTISQRQATIRELVRMPRFRDKLLMHATLHASERREGETLLRWLAADRKPNSLRPLLMWLVGLAIVNVPLFILNMTGSLPPLWLITWGLYVALTLSRWQTLTELIGEGLGLTRALYKLVDVLRFVESYPLRGQVRQHCAPLIEDRPSRRLRLFALTVGLVTGVQQNPFLWGFLNALLPWDVYFAYRFQVQKEQLAADLPRWLEVWFQLEALTALATFAYLNPTYTFPTIQDNLAPLFDARHIGHPLIPHTQRVSNDFCLDTAGELVMITGSNMSGKSSFLRTLGVNLCLAYAGTVVCAESLVVNRLRLFTSIRISDSLDDGISYFYAEVKRLKQLLDALDDNDSLPLLYLIDEIFRGTNNRERLIGSQAIIQKLAGGHGLGIIATHDLELTQLAEGSPLIHNAHFREEVIDGRMVFDYTLREGASPTTNALIIMQMEGLPILIPPLPLPASEEG